MYSRRASTATRSSFSRWESRPARTMCTFMVPPATGGSWPGAINSAVLTPPMIPLFAFAGCETVQKQYVRILLRRRPRVAMIKLLSRLPWAALYAFSAFLYFLAYYVVRHRDHVIREQLEKVFPSLSADERKDIHKQFLRSFCDVLIELLKSVSMTELDMRRRMRVTNPELPRQYLDARQSVMLMTSHMCTWTEELMPRSEGREPMVPIQWPVPSARDWEPIVLKNPANWLWSYRRWRLKKPLYGGT